MLGAFNIIFFFSFQYIVVGIDNRILLLDALYFKISSKLILVVDTYKTFCFLDLMYFKISSKLILVVDTYKTFCFLDLMGSLMLISHDRIYLFACLI
jgi:hypothetical protein